VLSNKNKETDFMPMLPITALYASILLFFYLHLAFQVVKARIRYARGLGYDHEKLLLAGRIHGNASEYIPFFLILMGLAEINGAYSIVVHGLGVAFTVARFLHAWGFRKGNGLKHAGRYWGTVITWLSMAGLALTNLVIGAPYLI